MPPAIRELAGKYLTNPAQVAVTPQATTVERVDQSAYFVDQRDKPALLATVLQGWDYDRVLVFTRTKHGADRVVRQLAANSIDSAAIHGNKSQPQRERALDAFRAGKTRVLVATDIAARGIDVEGVSHVINYELPNVSEQYVHRIGRTARAGRDGEGGRVRRWRGARLSRLDRAADQAAGHAAEAAAELHGGRPGRRGRAQARGAPASRRWTRSPGSAQAARDPFRATRRRARRPARGWLGPRPGQPRPRQARRRRRPRAGRAASARVGGDNPFLPGAGRGTA